MDLLTYKELVASKGLCPWSPGYSKLKEAGLDENFIFAKKKIAVGRYKLLLFRIQGGTLAQIGELLKFKKPQHIVWPVMGRCFAAYLSRIIEQLVHHLELRQEADKYIPFVKLTEYIGIGGYTIGDKPDGLSTIRIAYRNGRIYYLGFEAACLKAVQT